MDNHLIEKFQELGVSDHTKMTDYSVAWVPDSNGNAYNGQITFDLASLGISNKWHDYSNAYIQMPYVVAIKSSTDISAVSGLNNILINQIILKNNFANLIDSMSVECHGRTIQQVQSFSGLHTNFKMLTSFSTEDAVKNGFALGFVPGDSTLAWSNTATDKGLGVVNADEGSTRNQRLVCDPVALAAANPATLTSTSIINSGRSYISNDGGTAAARVYYIVYMATIRLRDICDFMDKIPLCKTTDIRLVITYNSARAVITAGTSNVLTLTSYQQLSGHTCPFMINTAATAIVDGTSFTIQSNVVRAGLEATAPTLAISQCRLYVPQFRIQDSVSLAMISSYPVTKFKYNDLYSYVIPSTVGNFNFTLTTGVQDPMYLVVVPFVRTTGLGGLGVSTYQSPFDSSPGTTSNVIIGEFQCMLGGENVFMQNERFDWEQFQDQLSRINAIMGNSVTGMTSGLLGQELFQNAYRYYIADLSRREPSSDSNVKSVVISGTIAPPANNLTFELICFIAYRKEVSITTSTGILVE